MGRQRKTTTRHQTLNRIQVISGNNSLDSRVAVFDFEGRHVTTLEDIPGAYGLFVENDLLYVAATEANQIFEFSLPSFELQNQFSTSPRVEPLDLTKVDGDLFVTGGRKLLRIDTQTRSSSLTGISVYGPLRNSIHDPNTFYAIDTRANRIRKVVVTGSSATEVDSVSLRDTGPVLDDVAVNWWTAFSSVDSGYYASADRGPLHSRTLELYAADDNRLLGSVDLQGNHSIHRIDFDRNASHLVVTTLDADKLRIIRLSERAAAITGQTSLGVAPDVESVLIRTAGGDDTVDASRLADIPVSLSIETGTGNDLGTCRE